MTSRKIGDIVDASGVEVDLDDHEQITAMVVLCKVVNFDTGSVAMFMEASEGLDWMDMRGLIASANDICSQPAEHPDEDEP